MKIWILCSHKSYYKDCWKYSSGWENSQVKLQLKLAKLRYWKSLKRMVSLLCNHHCGSSYWNTGFRLSLNLENIPFLALMALREFTVTFGCQCIRFWSVDLLWRPLHSVSVGYKPVGTGLVFVFLLGPSLLLVIGTGSRSVNAYLNVALQLISKEIRTCFDGWSAIMKGKLNWQCSFFAGIGYLQNLTCSLFLQCGFSNSTSVVCLDCSLREAVYFTTLFICQGSILQLPF